MRRWILALSALLMAPFASAAEPDYSEWGRLLGRYVTVSADGVNRVDYAGWRANEADGRALDAFITAMSAARPSAMSRPEGFAYWANLYNAVTIDVVLEKWPVRSIKDIPSTGAGLDPRNALGPWRTPRVTIEGRRMSLDDIEHGVLRPTYRDPRVHYAVNCASIGCPNLGRAPFQAATLDAQLDAAARGYINHARGVNATERGLVLSSIYKWFASDFGGEQGLRAHLAQYAEPALAERLAARPRILRYGYDWSVNATAGSAQNVRRK